MDVVVMEVEEEEEERENGSEDLKWENIMPRMVLRVLLVEADDSTRHIIGALLRKYNYKVAAISDGLKAWEILKRWHNSIDLILTELDLPSISGYALLTLIMEHDGCKNIPVIIMSSQDSISMVLKCLLKGAADFLVKPVRKNELKNLWRHVWKRLANNGGNNPQNLTIGQHKAEAPFENNQATNHSGDNVSSSWRSSDFSEKATDAQCLLRMKHHGEETEVNGREDKHQAKDVKLEEGLSLHTNVIDDNTDKLGSNVQLSKEVDVSTSPRVEDGSCAGIATDDGGKGPGNHTYRAKIAGHDLPQPSIEAVDLIVRIKEQEGAARGESFNGEFNGHNSTPALELSLKRPLNSETKEVHERQILNHSNASAFSWYSSIKKPRTSVPSSGGELPKIKGTADSLLWPKPCSSDLENKPNILAPQSAHCDPVSPHHQIGPVPLPGLAFDSGIWASYGAVFQPIFNPYTRPTARSPNSALQREESPLMTSPSKLSDPGTHSSIQGCGQAGDELKARESADQSGYSSSQVVDPSGSSSQSNDFGNQQNLSAHGSASEITDVNATAPGMKESSLIEETESCKPLVHDQFKLKMGLHSAEREAALAKFLQKRKNRCFEKKVRYQSRKKLAEQRPRVKGQFVRQVPNDQVLANDKL
ncbi:two-component response regulator-like APRR3 isoform X2 [Chenopodium quinoa]|uniref:two-component response regulator-like APRR3 isoform X2 n=1 Tax=Chenopodium quinoa TaxID=63459 RepID=UPI000B76BDC6|nr:two-component response regulator-like APRR3 isoform X2 [Chenopodium quinoa]